MYIQPTSNTSRSEFLALQGQYQFILTSACPIFNDAESQFSIFFSENTYSLCAPSCNVPETSFPPVVASCTNIDETFTIEFSNARAGGGLSCSSGLVSCTVDVSTNPSLPEDCILDTLILSGSSFDACEGFIG